MGCCPSACPYGVGSRRYSDSHEGLDLTTEIDLSAARFERPQSTRHWSQSGRSTCPQDRTETDWPETQRHATPGTTESAHPLPNKAIYQHTLMAPLCVKSWVGRLLYAGGWRVRAVTCPKCWLWGLGQSRWSE
jgi:hypothetical protein